MPNCQMTEPVFSDRLKAANLSALWENLAAAVPEQPVVRCSPASWNYQQDIRPLILEAGRTVTAEQAERRVLLLSNPGLQGMGITHTLVCGIQMIVGGEIASSHRHTQSAMRIVLEGEGAYTAVNGDRMSMEFGDYITTPAWTWHDHGKQTEGEMIWLDGLDLPIVNYLALSFFEDHPDDQHPQTVPGDDSIFRYGSGMLPLTPLPQDPHSPVYKYPYSKVREVLSRMVISGAPDAFHGYKLRYAHPFTGGHTLPTIGSFVQLLPAGFRTQPVRATDARVFVVLEGSCSFDLGGTTWTCGKRDVMVVPNWTSYTLQADAEAVVFSFSDCALQEKLGLWREQHGSDDKHA